MLAEAFGLPDPDAVAADVLLVAGVYLDGDGEAADTAVARLMAVLLSADEPPLPGDMAGHDDGAPLDPASARLEAAADRIGLLVQACAATGRLVRSALPALPADAGRHGIEEILAETLRLDPPVRVMHRVARRPTRVGDVGIEAGDTVTLDIAAANRDPEVFTRPDDFEPHRTTPSLTFGSEPRRCRGHRQACALAAGILGYTRTLETARGLGSRGLDEAA